MTDITATTIRLCALHGKFVGLHCVPCYAKETSNVLDEYNRDAEIEILKEQVEQMSHPDSED